MQGNAPATRLPFAKIENNSDENLSYTKNIFIFAPLLEHKEKIKKLITNIK